MDKQKVSLVLSGGGARGIAHIGVIEKLIEEGYEISSIAGTSMGALVGGVYALGKLEQFKDWLFTLDRLKVFTLIDFTFNKQGLVKGDRILNTMKDFIPDTNIEDLNIPYVAIATDIINRKEIIFNNGSIYEAIRASIAIPSVFTPVKTKDGLLVDGGVLNNIPINRIERTNEDILIVVNVNADVPRYKPKINKKEIDSKTSVYRKRMNEFNSHFHKLWPINEDENETHFGYLNLLERTISLMTNHMAEMNMKNYSPDIYIKISYESCSTFDFYKAEEMVEIGRNVATQYLKEIRNPDNKFSPIWFNQITYYYHDILFKKSK